MKTRILGIGSSLLLAIMLCSVAISQDQPQRGQRGQGGGFGFGFGGGRGGGLGGAADLVGLLRMEEVRKEVGLSEEGYAAIQQLDEERQALRGGGGRGGPGGAGGGRGGPGGGGFTPPPPPDPVKLKELNDKYMAILDEVLEPKGMDRLIGLFVQQTGMPAATNELIAKKINVGGDQLEKIKGNLEKATTAQSEKTSAAFQGFGGAGGFQDLSDEDRQKFRDNMTKLQEEGKKASDEAVTSVLDDAQEKALNDLKGAEFKFPEFGGFGGGRGAPGGGGQGQGGGRGRPGGDQGGGRGGRAARPSGIDT